MTCKKHQIQFTTRAIWNKTYPDHFWKSESLKVGKITPTNVRSAKNIYPLRKSSPCTSELTTKSNLHQIQTIQLAKPKFTTVVFAARCCPPSARWTGTCLSTQGNVLFRVNFADKLSPPTETCTDTRELTTLEINNCSWMKETRQPVWQLQEEVEEERGAYRQVPVQLAEVRKLQNKNKVSTCQHREELWQGRVEVAEAA